MLNILKVSPLLCVYFTLAKAQRMPSSAKDSFVMFFVHLCTLARGLAGNCGGEDQPLKFPVFDGRLAVGQEYGENEAG